MTPKQMQTARLVRLGYTNQEIADIQGVKRGTVRIRLCEMYRKIGAQASNPRVELATWYVKRNR